MSRFFRRAPSTASLLLPVFALVTAQAACSSSSTNSSGPDTGPGSDPGSPGADARLTPATSTATLDGLGTIQVTFDTARQDVEAYDTRSESGVNLHVTDANGYAWDLSIPGGALLLNTTMTMTPFSAIDLSSSQSGIVSGVKLEPDGLYFSHQAYLTVSPPDGVDPGLALVFDLAWDAGDPSAWQVALGQSSRLDTSSTANVWHFSGLGYGDGYGDDALAALVEQAKQEYQTAVVAAKLFVKGPAPTPPVPPAISMFCRGTEANPEENESYEFVRQFLSPYEDVLTVLLRAMRALQLVGGAGVDMADGYSLSTQIAQMAVTSILQVGKTWSLEAPPDHLFAVISATLAAARHLELMGGSPGDALGTITVWAQKMFDYYLGQLKKEHDYRAYPILLTLAYDLELLGGSDELGAIFSAMTFEVQITTSMTMNCVSADDGKTLTTGSVQQTADVKNLASEAAAIDGTADVFGTPQGKNMVLTSTAGTYIQGSTKDLTGQTDTGSLWLKNWDPCVTKSFDALMSFYGTNNESAWITQDGTEIGLPSHYWADATGFMFTVPMTNLSPTFGDQTFTGSGTRSTGNPTTASASVEVKIIHTPQ